MAENNSILHELYVFSEWKPEPEYLQKPDNILPENISSLWRWLKFFGPKKSLIDSVAAHKERQQKWCIALGDEGKVIAVLTDNILEIRTKRSEYAIIAARTTVARDAYTQWRKLVWSPDCSFIVVAYGNGVVSFFDLTASSLFNIPVDCSRPGGLECTDNTHAVSEIIFIPLRVKDTKWNWEVLVLTYDGKLRGYLVSQTDGFKLHHTFQFPGGVSVACYSEPHSTLYIAGVPRTPYKDPSSPVSAGITAWRVLNDEPFYKLSVVSDELEAQLANKRFHLYIPLIFTKNMNIIIEMAVSPDNSKLVCIHCNGDISIWRLPILKGEYRFKLTEQPEHDMQNPLSPERSKEQSLCYPAGVNWWSNEDVILSRFSGAVSVCRVKDLVNILGKKPEFFQGTPQVTSAYDGTFMTLECESNVLPARKSASDQSMEVVEADADIEDSMLDITKELFKSILYAITDIETFQPKPKKITIVSRIYRLLGVKSTTPTELFSRKIESGSYKEALSLAERFELDSDLVYQQQWRKNPVSSDAIDNYLSKVSKKIWAVHQCVDRLPESLPAAKELLSFGLQLTNEKILDEINGNLPQDEWKDPDDITMEDLNAYTSELLRCRHVMIFYKERLGLYEAILHCEKSTYVKDEYHRLRSNSIVHSAMEIAKEGRIEALTCLWPYIKSLTLQLAVLDKLPETLYPLDYQHLLPTKEPVKWFEKKSPIKIKPSEYEHDWCRKEIFRSIWSSNWSEDAPLEPLAGGDEDKGGDEAAGGDICAGEGGAEGGDGAVGTTDPDTQLAQWYTHRARQIEERSGLVSHALTLVMIAAAGGAVPGLEPVVCLLETLDMLLYDINVEDVTLSELEKMSNLEVCKLLMKMSTHATFVSDLKKYVIPFLKRHEDLTKRMGTCLSGLIDFLENISIEDLSYILLVLQSPKEFELDVRTHLELVERCLFAHSGTDQLDMACDLLTTILKETDGSISTQSLVRRAGALERAVAGSGRLAWRGVRVPPCALRRLAHDAAHAHMLLTRVARSLATGEQKPTQQDWEHLLKDMLELRATLFDCITEEKCYEMYVSSLLTSGDAPSIRLAADVLSISAEIRPMQNGHYRVDYVRSVELVSNAAKEYFNSASSLTDPALELARCCLLLIQDNNIEIEKELDLIAALPILSAFNVSMLPIQVRLCEDKMHLIEECLNAEPNAYLASHKLLKLAKLLRIAGNDEQTREGMILTCVVERALSAGAAGGMAAASAAHRLAALRHVPAAALLARVAAHAHSHADTAERRALLAAAAALAPAHMLGDVLKARLQLELESMQEMGVALIGRETDKQVERWPSTEEEFADAITTPVIEKKDLVSSERPIPILNYLLDTFQNKFSLSEKSKASGGGGDSGGGERAVHCQEFYRSLYSHAQAAGGVDGGAGCAYEQFSAADAPGAAGAAPHRLLHCFYAAACLDGATGGLEDQVIKKCSEDLVNKDTALSVAVLLRGHAGSAAGEARVALAVALYAALLRCNATVLRDHAYLAEPRNMAYLTLKQNNALEDQMAVIRHYLDKLNGMGEVDRLRRLGLSVNSLLFNADRDYRTEVIYRFARTGGSEHARISCALAEKYELDVVDVWLQYAAVSLPTVELHTIPAAAYVEEAYKPIRDALWPSIRGNDYPSLISFFTILKKIDDKIQMHGLNVGEHLRLLKKAKAASPDLDYKMIVERAPSAHFSAHVLSVMRADNAGMVCKLLRTLPPAVAPPADAHRLYIKWLTGYFFSVAATGATKRWMQRWRQCVGFFTKLSKDEIMEFVAAVCFSREALERVPSGTRNLIILQAMDYCQQEQGNDFKFAKNEQTWGQMGQELGRWGRFLENYHSSSVQAILDASDVPKDVWFELEMSHGALEGVTRALARAVAGGVRAAALASLLQCLRVPADAHHVLQRAADDAVNVEDIEVLVTRIAQYHKDGVKLSEEYLEKAMQKATELGLPPHKQLGLLSLSQRARVQDGEDVVKVAQFTVDLFKTEWPESAYAQELTEGKIVDPQGRREALRMLAPLADTWQRRKALADALACWPPTHGEDGRSLHCEYLQHVLAQDGQPADNLVLVKMLVRRPILTEQEVKLLAETARNDIVNTMWVILLNPFDSSHQILRNLLNKYKELVQKLRIEDELIKEILDQGMFIKLVSSPIYSNIVYYILNSKDQEHITYTAHWAIAELIKANYLAEAGHLQLLALGTTTSLLGFSESVLYCLDMMK